MRKDLYKNLAIYQFCQSNEAGKPDMEDPEFTEDNSELGRILKEIFSVDEKSGLPKGDIAYWLSNDGNPQVKDFIVNNLLKPTSVGGSQDRNITDDIIEEYSRRSDESVVDYAARLRGYYDQATEILNKPKDD